MPENIEGRHFLQLLLCAVLVVRRVVQRLQTS